MNVQSRWRGIKWKKKKKTNKTGKKGMQNMMFSSQNNEE
jgi:hypothetical protein